MAAAALLRCACGRLCLVRSDGRAACSDCGAVYVVAVRVEREGKKPLRADLRAGRAAR
jgi:hypothetical protein